MNLADYLFDRKYVRKQNKIRAINIEKELLFSLIIN